MAESEIRSARQKLARAKKHTCGLKEASSAGTRGSTDHGSFLVALAAHEQPTDNTSWLWPLGGGVLVIALGLVAWMVIRRKRNADLTASP